MEKISQEFIDSFYGNESDDFEVFQKEFYEKVNKIITLLMEVPDNSWLKTDIQDWLKVRHITYSASDTKATLLDKV